MVAADITAATTTDSDCCSSRLDKSNRDYNEYSSSSSSKSSRNLNMGYSVLTNRFTLL